MTTSFCTCNSPARRRKIADEASFEHGKVNEELQPLPNGFTDRIDGGEENAPCLLADEDVVADERSERQKRIQRVWEYYLAHNTLHGLHYVFDTKSISRKILWVAVLLVAGGVFFNEVKASITQYFDYPFSTLSTVAYPPELALPAISICDLRDIRRTMLNRSKAALTYNYGAPANFTGPPLSDGSMDGIIDEAFSLVDEIVISCSLKRGVSSSKALPCDRKNFTLFLSSSGHTCYTLNSGFDNNSLLHTDNVGPLYGVHMILNTRPLEDVTSGASGFKVILHQQGELPLMRVGFHVPPGYVTYVDMKKHKIKNLPSPYSTNCGGRRLDHFPEYTRNKCFLEGMTKHVINECGCRAWFMPESNENTSICSLNKTLECMWPIWEEYEQSNAYDCPVDCEKVTYEPQLSTALFLPQKLIPLKKYEALKRAKHMPNDTESMVKFMLDYYVGISFFYSELRVDVFEQTPGYGFFRLVGDVGGQLGLVLGASFITLLEVIDLLIMVFLNWFRGSPKKKDTL